MAEIYGRRDGLCGGYGGSMHLADPERGFLGTSGIVGQGIPQATGAAWAAQIRKQGQVVLCFFGDGASKQGAFHESLNLGSLWKLPIVYVMENNNYNVATRSEQEDANAAAGEPLSVKATAYSMPGVTVDGGDPVAVFEAVGAAVEPRPRRRGADPGRVQGLPPVGARQPDRAARASRCTTPSTRRSRCSATARSTRPRCAATRCRGSAHGSSSRARSRPTAPIEIAQEVRDEMEAAVQFALDDPFPEPEAALNHVYA